MKFWRSPLVIGAALILGWTAQGANAQLISGCPNANLADAFGNLPVTNLNGAFRRPHQPFGGATELGRSPPGPTT
jgi:hypothetical protein